MITAEQIRNEQTKNDYGLVSIIMPNYNSDRFVEETIRSVLDQTYSNWELLFVDDCSSDGSLDIVRAIDDERIRVFPLLENSGAAVARNVAIKEARGKWIAFLDSDDLWDPAKLERQLDYMRNNEVCFSFTDYYVMNNNDAQVSVFKPSLDKCDYEDILKHNYIGCLTAIYDAEKLGKAYMPTNAEKREDMACWLSILKKGICAHCLHEPLATYKVHSNSVSSNKAKMIKYQWNVYRKVENLSIVKSLYYMTHWAIKGVLKYR